MNACKNHFGKTDNIKLIMNKETWELYKQAGNGVTVNVIEAIGRLLQKADSELNAQEVSEKGIY